MEVGEVSAKFVVDDSQWGPGMGRVESSFQSASRVVQTEGDAIEAELRKVSASAAKSSGEIVASVDKLSKFESLQAGVAVFQQLSGAVSGFANDFRREAQGSVDTINKLRGAFGDLAADREALIDREVQLGFDGNALADSLITLKKFGVDSEDVLRRLEDEAKGTNVSITALSESFGKFEKFGDAKSLLAYQKALGASNADLKNFGAVLDDNNKVLLDNEARINAAKDALAAYSAANFAGAAERATSAQIRFNAELGNLQDDIGTAVVALEQKFYPAALAAVEALRGLPDGVKAFVGLGTQFVATGGQVAAGALQMGANIAILTGNVGFMTAATAGATRGLGLLRIGLTAALGPLGLALTAIGGLAVAINAYTQELESAAKAGAELAKADADRLKAGRDQRDLVGKSAEEIRSLGKSSKDVTALIAGLREQGQLALDQGNKAGEASIRAKIREAIAVRAELLEIEKQQKAAELAAPTKKDAGKADKDAAKKERLEAAAAKKEESATEKAAEQERKDALDARLAQIRQQTAAGELSKQQQIEAYRAVVAELQVTAKEQQSIDLSIAQLQGQLRQERTREEEKANQERLQAEAKAARDRAFAVQKAEAEAKREAADKERQQQADAGQIRSQARERAQLEAAEISKAIKDLEPRLGQSGVLDQIRQLLQRRQALIIQGIEAERDLVIQSTTNEEIRAGAIANANLKIQAVNQDTTREMAAETEKQNQILKGQVGAVDKAVTEIQQIKSRVGGKNSPLFSDPTEGLGISLGDFGLGDVRKQQAAAARPQFQVLNAPAPEVKFASVGQDVARSLQDAPLAITVQVGAGAAQQTKTFSGSASDLARSSNVFNPAHQLGQV